MSGSTLKEKDHTLPSGYKTSFPFLPILCSYLNVFFIFTHLLILFNFHHSISPSLFVNHYFLDKSPTYKHPFQVNGLHCLSHWEKMA